jgi:hypothetical protein
VPPAAGPKVIPKVAPPPAAKGNGDSQEEDSADKKGEVGLCGRGGKWGFVSVCVCLWGGGAFCVCVGGGGGTVLPTQALKVNHKVNSPPCCKGQG